MLKLNIKKYYSTPSLLALDENNFIVHDKIREIEKLLNREGNFNYSKTTEKAVQDINDMIELEVTNTSSWEKTLTKLELLLKNGTEEYNLNEVERINNLEKISIKEFNSYNLIENRKKSTRKRVNRHIARMTITSFLIGLLNLLYTKNYLNFNPEKSSLGLVIFFVSLCALFSPLLLLSLPLSFNKNESSFCVITDSFDVIEMSLWFQLTFLACCLNPILFVVSILQLKRNRDFAKKELNEIIILPNLEKLKTPNDIYNSIVKLSDYDLPKRYKDELIDVFQSVWIDGPEEKTEIKKALLKHLESTNKRIELININ